MKLIRKQRLICAFLAVSLIVPMNGNAQVVQSLSGVAISVDVPLQKLNVRFEHPATGENLLKVFEISPRTGFKNVKKLSEIKPNDPVSVDYEDNGKKGLEAIHVEVVSLEKLPFDEEKVKRSFRW